MSATWPMLMIMMTVTMAIVFSVLFRFKLEEKTIGNTT